MSLLQKILSVVISLFLFADNCFSSSYTKFDDNYPMESKEISGLTSIPPSRTSDLDILKTIEKKNPSELHILFLCEGNATRSQIAEGWLKHLGGETIKVMSAGLDPRPVNLKAIQIMNDAFGLNIQNPMSKMLTTEMITWADLVITTCHKSDERCPVLPNGTAKLHWFIESYPGKSADEEKMRQQLCAMSNEIQQHALQLLESLKEIHLIEE